MSKYTPLDSNESNNNNANNNISNNNGRSNQILVLSDDDERDGEEIDLTDNNNRGGNVNERTNLVNNQQQQQQQEEEEYEEEADLEDFSHMIIAILKPVTITMFLVVCAVRTLSFSGNFSQYVGITMYYNESTNDSTGTKIWGSLLNGLIFLVTIILTTVAFVFLYKYRCLKAIYAWLFLSVGILLGATGGYIFMSMLQANNLAIDYISFIFILLNFSAGGIISIFWYAPTLMNQSYLVIISSLMAISFTRLPSWTTWSILAIVSIYDLFAVLCPKGPLRVLVETAQERNETIPALIYNANFDAPVSPIQQQSRQEQIERNGNDNIKNDINNDQIRSRVTNQNNDDQQQQPQGNQEFEPLIAQNIEQEEGELVEEVVEKQRSLKLGLGDFVFYSVLMGRAALFDMSTVFTCFVAIVTGLFATLLLLAIFKKALPALPISIAFGILFYFLSSVFLYPFIEALGTNQVFV